MSIHYFCEDVDFLPSHQNEVSQWIMQIAADHSYSIESLNYIFCSDPFLLEINKDYLNHDYLTDIITFDNSDTVSSIEADIFISIDRVKENAQELDYTFEQELHRVMVHGLLHLIGYNDKSSSEKEHMREKETACLSLLQVGGST